METTPHYWDIDVSYIESWLLSLDQDSYEQIIAALNLLQREGPQLGRPLVDRIKGSEFSNMKELRPGSKGKSEIRILFIFDPSRKAIFLVGGDKEGTWNKWYKKNIPLADSLYAQYLAVHKGEK